MKRQHLYVFCVMLFKRETRKLGKLERHLYLNHPLHERKNIRQQNEVGSERQKFNSQSYFELQKKVLVKVFYKTTFDISKQFLTLLVLKSYRGPSLFQGRKRGQPGQKI